MFPAKTLDEMVRACDQAVERLAEVHDDPAAEPLRREVEELRAAALAALEQREHA